MNPAIQPADLGFFSALARAGSLSAAARDLRVTTAAVSRHLAQMEKRLGVLLVNRTTRRMGLTPEGEVCLEHARRILALNELALQELRGHALEGELRLAVTDYFRPGEIAGMLRRLRERYPYLRLHVTVMKSAAIDAAAEMDAFDIGLSMRLPRGRDTQGRSTRGTVLRREPLAWVAASGEADAVPATLPLVLLPDTCSLHRFVVQLLLRKRLPFEIAHSASGVAGLHLALAAGLGLSCLNASAIGPGVAPLDGGTVARLGLPRLPDAEFFLLPARRSQSPFIAEARNVLAEQLA